MTRRAIDIRTLCAVLLAMAAFALTALLFDSTPLLIEPSPDLDWPLGLAGFGLGLWSARQLTRLRHLPKRRLGRAALWIMLPLMLSLGLVALGDRVHEAISFRASSTVTEATVPILEKSRNTSRRGRVTYDAGLANPFGGRAIRVRIDQPTFDRIAPLRSCVAILIERAPNGAARLLAPVRWKAACAKSPVARSP